MEHTTGKLVLRIDGRPELNNQNEILESEDGKHLVVYFKFKNREDARRLVACWNACDTVSTEFLEQLAAMPDNAIASYEAIKAQRDELLAGLQLAYIAMQHMGNVLNNIDAVDEEEDAQHDAAFEAVAALIAKHKEASHG